MNAIKKRENYREPALCQNNVCEHDSHCGMCAWGQYDYDNDAVPAEDRRDALSWCGDCDDDICDQCDCGHDNWGA
jgi:hypothetical protein